MNPASVILIIVPCVALLYRIKSIQHLKIEHCLLSIEHFVFRFNVEPLRGSKTNNLISPRVKTRGYRYFAPTEQINIPLIKNFSN
jgi:hypothetical protein